MKETLGYAPASGFDPFTFDGNVSCWILLLHMFNVILYATRHKKNTTEEFLTAFFKSKMCIIAFCFNESRDNPPNCPTQKTNHHTEAVLLHILHVFFGDSIRHSRKILNALIINWLLVSFVLFFVVLVLVANITIAVGIQWE